MSSQLDQSLVLPLRRMTDLSAVNDALKAKFLDLKEGAFVVSLRTFQHGSSHVRTCALLQLLPLIDKPAQINDIGNILAKAYPFQG